MPSPVAPLGAVDESSVVGLKRSWRALFDKVHSALIGFHWQLERSVPSKSNSLAWEAHLLTRMPNPQQTSTMTRVGLFVSIAANLGEECRECRPPVMLGAPMLDGDDQHRGEWHVENMRRFCG